MKKVEKTERKATKAISYLRYSTKKQAKSGSEKRQLEWAQKYCEANGMKLVDTYRDLGISAHRGKHSKEGNLARLLEDCKSGKIPKGYALIVENFDRLSREEVPVALQRFLTLINDYELEIHTLDDKRIYQPGKIDLTELIISIVIMGRAHSESARKAVLTAKAWKNTRESGKAHSKPGKKPLGNFPNWLDWDSAKQSWIVKEDYVATIKYIFQLVTESNLGRYQIAQRLNHEKVPMVTRWAKRWSAPTIKDITNNRALLGEWVPRKTNDKDAEVVKNYYPAVIEVEIFEECQKAQRLRSHLGAGGGRPVKIARQYSILTGIAWFREHRLNKGYYRRKQGKEIVDTYGIAVGGSRKMLGQADPLEYFACSIIAELDHEELAANTGQKRLEQKLKVQLTAKQGKLREHKAAVENWILAIGIAGADLPELVEKVQQSKYQISILVSEIEDIEFQISEIVTGSGVHNQKEVSLLKEKALTQKDLESRQDLHVALNQLIERLDFGLHPEELPDCSNDFLMHAMTLHATTPIKFWVRIKLFNESIILGAMSEDGKIARIRWEE